MKILSFSRFCKSGSQSTGNVTGEMHHNKIIHTWGIHTCICVPISRNLQNNTGFEVNGQCL